MRVNELMTKDVETVAPYSSLAVAVEHLWRRDCGILPVVGVDGKTTGVVTDRDIAIALGTRHQVAAHLTVGEVMSGVVYSCYGDDDVSHAIQTMKTKKVRRLPVLDRNENLVGIISIADIARACGPGGPKASQLSYEVLGKLMNIICQHPKHSTVAVA